MRKTYFALAAVILAMLGGCAVVPVQSGYSYDYGYGYSYGYVETRPAVVVPYGYYGGGYRYHPRHPAYRYGPRGRW